MLDETEEDINIQYHTEDAETNRRHLFSKALSCARNGKVLYILREELTELPQLSQDLASVNRHYMKMISFLYVKNLQSLIESVSTLPDWQSVPNTIIIENLDAYCPQERMQNACGVVALLTDTARRCSAALKAQIKLLISINRDVGDEYCNLLKELFPTL